MKKATEVFYNAGLKDSGNVKGTLFGDTEFMGEYYHMHDGQDEWKRVPLLLLKRKNKLIRRAGIVATFANIPFFLNYPPVQFNETEQFVLYPAK